VAVACLLLVSPSTAYAEDETEEPVAKVGTEAELRAFPGEEPPQIERNEDAGGQDTDE
jgi:hypothetical protein